MIDSDEQSESASTTAPSEAGDVDPAPAGARPPHGHVATALAVTAFIIMLLGPRLIAQPVTVAHDSMAPTLHDGDHLLVDKLTYRWRDPHRGEVVVAHNPRTGEQIVKRVVAVGGDEVGIDEGRLVVNGTVIAEDYADQSQMSGFFFGPVIVPTGGVFLLGDNRIDSIDSRNFGPVDVDAVTGRVIVRLWPR